jgi:hypothetical protein
MLCIATTLTETSDERDDFGQILVGRLIAPNILGPNARDFRRTSDSEQFDLEARGRTSSHSSSAVIGKRRSRRLEKRVRQEPDENESLPTPQKGTPVALRVRKADPRVRNLASTESPSRIDKAQPTASRPAGIPSCSPNTRKPTIFNPVSNELSNSFWSHACSAWHIGRSTTMLRPST